jgi:protease-4
MQENQDKEQQNGLMPAAPEDQESNAAPETPETPDLAKPPAVETAPVPPAPQAPPKKSSLKKSLLILGAILAGIVLIGVGCSSLSNMMKEALGIYDDTGVYQDYDSEAGDHVAVLYVEGVITASSSTGLLSEPNAYDHQFLLDTIDRAMERDDNRGLMLFVNSPGGGVYESDELYLKIREYQTATQRPVYVYMASMAASGGYYISAPADMIYANRNCWTGSIGVTMGTFYDISGLLEKYGVKAVTITAGRNKAMGSTTEPMTAEQLRIFQSLVDEAYTQFVTIVAEGRNLKIDEVRALADGRIYTASQARDLGLVDEIGSFEDAVYAMQVNEDLEDCDFISVAPPQPTWLDQLLGEVRAANQNQGDLTTLLALMDRYGNTPVSYLCTELYN